MTVNERVKWKLSGRGRVSVHLALGSRSLLGGGGCAGEGRALLCAARSLIPVTSCACGGVWRGNRSVYI